MQGTTIALIDSKHGDDLFHLSELLGTLKKELEVTCGLTDLSNLPWNHGIYPLPGNRGSLTQSGKTSGYCRLKRRTERALSFYHL